MANKKQTNLRHGERKLSVTPVTSRERTGDKPRKTDLRAALIRAWKQELGAYSRALQKAKRLDAAIRALGKGKA